MKRIILIVLLLAVLIVGCGQEPPPTEIIPCGNIISVTPIERVFGDYKVLEINTVDQVIYVYGFHSVKIGAPVEIVKNGFYYDGNYVDCLRIVNSDVCWMIFE